MIKLIKFLILTLAVSLLFTACGGGSGGGSSDNTMTNDEIVAADKDDLNIAYTTGDSINNVTAHLILVTEGTYGSTITWSSDDTGVIEINGTVNRPAYGSGDAAVTLIAIITKGSASETKTFNLTVKEAPLTAGKNLAYTLPSSISFNMKYAPGGTFPTGTDDLGGSQTISTPFWMAETEVTYELWYAVRTWARANGYTLNGNPGREGHDGTITVGAGAVPTAAKLEPVTTINWREAMVWCNALTEYYNANNGTDTDLDLVYYTDSGYTSPIRAATDVSSVNSTSGSEDNPYVKSTAKGFRLPGSMEWEYAARYRGSDAENTVAGYENPYYTKGNSASGAKLAFDHVSTDSGDYAWYSVNSGSKPHVVGTAGNDGGAVYSGNTNTLGLYDMSGNVFEWCFDWHLYRGGSWLVSALSLRVGRESYTDPFVKSGSIGFRFVRSQ